MRRLFLALAAPALLVSCSTTSLSSLSPAQRLYEAHGYYNIALGVAVDYAESRYADPGVVSALNSANQQAVPALRYGEAFIGCAGDANSQDPIVMAANVKCAGLDLSPDNVAEQASTLKSLAKRVFKLLAGG